MILRFKTIFAASLGALLTVGCQPPPPTSQSQPSTNNNTVAVTQSPSPAPTAAVSPSPSPVAVVSNSAPVTLPVLDAMFADETFAGELKSKLDLSDEQVEKLRATAREATANLKENEDGSTEAAKKRADEQIGGVIGEEKTKQLGQFVSERWNKGENGNTSNASSAAANLPDQPGSVPTDTRIVVNAPAYRMDVFRDGKLLKSYKVGIGYPEFPLPTGMRKAGSIIFNPTWTPPDEPWVEGSKTVKAGQKVEAGSKLNPLGPIKIPIGMPSLIHGGKSAAKLGGFASHGCVGLTDAQIKDFAANLAQISNTELKKEDVANYEKNKTVTKNVKLASVIPVELRYETIVVEDGKLHIYRDVYEHGTNTEANLRKVLEANGVSLDSLSETERDKIMAGLKQMARDASGKAAAEDSAKSKANDPKSKSAKVTRTIKGAKEFVIEIAELKGKGYPAPLNLSKG